MSCPPILTYLGGGVWPFGISLAPSYLKYMKEIFRLNCLLLTMYLVRLLTNEITELVNKNKERKQKDDK